MNDITTMLMVSLPGYCTMDKTYATEENLYDDGTEALPWTLQSKAYNPLNVVSVSRDYAKFLGEQVKKDYRL